MLLNLVMTTLLNLIMTKVDLKQFRRISCDVTECDKGLAVVKRVVAPEPCFHDRQCEAPTFGVVD